MKEKITKTEVCCNSFESAIAAESGGADRIELCENLEVGGITPSAETLKSVIDWMNIPVFVLIRPRKGGFVYSDDEIERMQGDIRKARNLGVQGIVVGCLDKNNQVDMPKMQLLIKSARELPVTFHRAFDEVKDPFLALEQIFELGCKRILTSGQKPTAPEGSALIRELIEKAGDRIIIMPGAGIRVENIAELKKNTGAKEFHFSASKKSAKKIPPLFPAKTQTDEGMVKKMIALLNKA